MEGAFQLALALVRRACHMHSTYSIRAAICVHMRAPHACQMCVHCAFRDSYAGRAFRYSEATHTTPADVPAKPAAPLVALMGAQVMEVSWAAPLANGSPIEWFALHMGVVTPSGASGGVTEVRIGHVRPGLAIRSLHVRPHRAGTRCCGQPLLGCRVTAQTQPRLMGTGDFQRTLYQIDHGVGRFRNIGSQGSSHTPARTRARNIGMAFRCTEEAASLSSRTNSPSAISQCSALLRDGPSAVARRD